MNINKTKVLHRRIANRGTIHQIFARDTLLNEVLGFLYVCSIISGNYT